MSWQIIFHFKKKKKKREVLYRKMISDLFVISFYANEQAKRKYLFWQFANHFAFNLDHE